MDDHIKDHAANHSVKDTVVVTRLGSHGGYGCGPNLCTAIYLMNQAALEELYIMTVHYCGFPAFLARSNCLKTAKVAGYLNLVAFVFR